MGCRTVLGKSLYPKNKNLGNKVQVQGLLFYFIEFVSQILLLRYSSQAFVVFGALMIYYIPETIAIKLAILLKKNTLLNLKLFTFSILSLLSLQFDFGIKQ